MKQNYSSWTPTRHTITFIVLALLGLFYLHRVKIIHHAEDSFNTPQCVSKDIQEQYSNYNRWWFNDELPKDTVVIWADAGGNMGQTRKMSGAFLIEINPKYAVVLKQAAEAELHEMCHVKTWGKDLENDGPRFQACMLNLAKAGAFANLW